MPEFCILVNDGVLLSLTDKEAELLKAHDAEQRAEIARLRGLLKELHAVVQGECPSLLNEE